MKCLSLIFIYAMSLVLCSVLSCSEQKFDTFDQQVDSSFQEAASSQNILSPSGSSHYNATMVIFIHGTLGLRSNASFSTALCLFHDCFSCSCYKCTVDILRDDPTFYQYQAMQQEGLIPIAPLSEGFSGSALFSDMFDQNLLNTNPYLKSQKRLYYTFGWSGMLSPTARYKAAQRLYKELKEELATLKKQGIYPQIIAIGYSHGGNVLLNLARVWEETNEQKAFTIDTTVFLGIPVQPDTSGYIRSTLFNNIYNFYSRGDYVQCCDCFSVKRFCSGRKFKADKHGYLPEKLLQMEIKMLTSSEKCCACSSKKGLFIDRSPGHSELWTYAWTKDSYRTTFPLYPLPVAIFVPQLIKLVEKHKYISHKLVATLNPQKGSASIRGYREYEKTHAQFIDPQIIEDLKHQAWAYAPKDFHKHYYQRIKDITKQAHVAAQAAKG